MLRCKHDREICEECASPALRARTAIFANPYDTISQLAEKARVGHATIEREQKHLLQITSPEGVCNKHCEPTEWHPMERPVPNPIGSRPAVMAVKSALLALCKEERDYLKTWIKERGL